jgi:DNA-cytosine methyltransferase
MRLTHSSFFSGVGGLDLGFERAGIETISLCENDPYASAVLARHWPNIYNHGDIVALAAREASRGEERNHQLSFAVQHAADEVQRPSRPVDAESRPPSGDDWQHADIWSGGFPCQDLSVAGGRKGFTGERSVLAFTFLDLVERYRPRWLVLENVPGIFTSNGGRDFLRLISEVDKLGYGVSWRTLDARYFGVPQRRSRVFIVASLGTNRASEVLFECEGGCGHSKASASSWQATPPFVDGSPEVAGAILARYRKGATSTVETGQLILTTALTRGGMGGGFGPDDNDAQGNKLVIGSQADASGVREADGLGGRLDNRAELEQSQEVRSWRKSRRAQSKEAPETWVEDGIANTLNVYDIGDIRATQVIQSVETFGAKTHRSLQARDWKNGIGNQDIGGDNGFLIGNSAAEDSDPLLPNGLDGNRYRCCGNGVVANVAEWIGRRIVAVDQQ